MRAQVCAGGVKGAGEVVEVAARGRGRTDADGLREFGATHAAAVVSRRIQHGTCLGYLLAELAVRAGGISVCGLGCLESDMRGERTIFVSYCEVSRWG